MSLFALRDGIALDEKLVEEYIWPYEYGVRYTALQSCATIGAILRFVSIAALR